MIVANKGDFIVYASSLDESDKTSLTLPCCGAGAVFKISPTGEKFFAHPPGANQQCDWKKKSASHDTILHSVLALGQRNGFELLPYVKEDGVCVDIVLVDPKAKSKLAVMIETAAFGRRDYKKEAGLLLRLGYSRVYWLFPENISKHHASSFTGSFSGDTDGKIKKSAFNSLWVLMKDTVFHLNRFRKAIDCLVEFGIDYETDVDKYNIPKSVSFNDGEIYFYKNTRVKSSDENLKKDIELFIKGKI